MMNKKNLGIIVVIILITALAVGIWQWKTQKKSDIVEQNNSTEQLVEKNTAQTSNQSGGIDTSDWKVYRNEEYGFMLNYPTDWEVNVQNTKINMSGDDLFFFTKDKRNNFAVFPRGGFGHGIQEPKKVTEGAFKGKNAKMFWYDHPFPLYIHILNDYPQNWNEENVIDIKISDNDQDTINSLRGMYDSFQFIE